MTATQPASPDTAVLRKARGAYFTPPAITDFIAEWAVRSGRDRVLEPSCGDAEFLVSAVARLRALDPDHQSPVVDGVELHEASALAGHDRVRLAGGELRLRIGDFFRVAPVRDYDAVIGNPPFIRFQSFTGDARSAAQRAALAGGVALTGLASSWAAFVVHAAQFLRSGGRLALVLPAELLSVNYAGPIRRFLLENFRSVDVVMFEEQVFPGAMADVVLLLADGYSQGPARHATFAQSTNAETLDKLGTGAVWMPSNPADKWSGNLLSQPARQILDDLSAAGILAPLGAWGRTKLGIVTGNNKYFTMTPARARELGLTDRELTPISPPGSQHLRGLQLTDDDLQALGTAGRSTLLFTPAESPTPAASSYVRAGETAGVAGAYKCRVRKPWYAVPLQPSADLLLTCMNAQTPQLVTNTARALHLNSVHGVYLRPEVQSLGAEVLPLASLNSASMLHAEIVGRSYGGGILKIEPREADSWLVPSPQHLRARLPGLRAIREEVIDHLVRRDLQAAARRVDEVLFSPDPSGERSWDLGEVRHAREVLAQRRRTRGSSGR